MPKKESPTKTEIVKMQALSQIGQSNRAIGRTLGWSNHTVAKYIRQELSPEERAEVDKLVEQVKKSELADLTLIGAKARAHLHRLLDEGNMKAIETVATMDRSFQQRTLLEDRSTVNIDIIAKVEALQASQAELEKEARELEAMLEED